MSHINIPTGVSQRETEELRRVAQGKIVVECGSLLGYSTIVLAGVAKHVTAIDKHEGYGGPTFKLFKSNLARFGVENVTPVVSTVEGISPIQAEVAFIDLDGTFQATSEALKKLRASIVMIHDVERVRCEGVARAIKAYKLVTLSHIDSLCVCCRDFIL